MRFFDYIYYRIYHLYKHKWNDDDPKMYAIGLVSLLQFMNIITFLFFYLFLIHKRININKIYVIVFFMAIIGLNYFRHRENGNSFMLLENKFKKETLLKHEIFGYLIVCYILLSISLSIASAYL